MHFCLPTNETIGENLSVWYLMGTQIYNPSGSSLVVVPWALSSLSAGQADCWNNTLGFMVKYGSKNARTN